MVLPADLIGTIDSEEEIDEVEDELDAVEDIDNLPEQAISNGNSTKRKRKSDSVGISETFLFETDLNDQTADLQGWQYDDMAINRHKTGIDIDEIIKKRKLHSNTGNKQLSRTSKKTNDTLSSKDNQDVLSIEESGDDEGDDEHDLRASHETDNNIDSEEDENEEEFEGFASDSESLGTASDHNKHVSTDVSATDQISGPTISEAEEEENEEEDGGQLDSAGVSHPFDQLAEEEDVNEEISAEELQKQKDFFAPEESGPPLDAQAAAQLANFQHMNLSRPILRALTAMNFTKATPIQAKAIPVALLGKDVVGGAVTGSGKTAAFMIPILERLLYRPKKISTTRVLVLCPTRELAMQCHAVSKKLAIYTDIRCSLVVGGLSLKMQEIDLRTRPDIVIATPGRFIDHIRNSQGFSVENIEIMVMDEADRMLEEGFAEELNEIIKACPRSRQTMLFSATMTDKVDDLIRLSLNKPVRLMVDAKKSTAENLVQEFIRIRPQREHTRPAILAHLCTELFKQRVIIFFRSKVYAHKMRIVFGLLDLKAGELHGNLSQEQRVQALESFRDGKIDFLLATDVASRGLDIKAIDTVINYEAPQSHEIYLHRVGRTARAGRQGRSVTLAGEADRKVVKAAVKSSNTLKSKVQSRTLAIDAIDAMHKRLEGMESEIEAIMKDEAQEKQLRQAEMELKKGENAIKYQAEIQARPRRTWFATATEKKESEQRGSVRLNPEATNAGASRRTGVAGKLGSGQIHGREERMGPPPTSNKQKKRLDDTRERSQHRQMKKPSSKRQR